MLKTRIDGPSRMILDNGRTRIKIVNLAFDATLSGNVETALCVVSGSGVAVADDAGEVSVGAGDCLHLPSDQAWSFRASSGTAQILQVESHHPDLSKSGRLMSPLASFDVVQATGAKRFRYSDYFRGGMIVLGPGEGVPRHFHERADELFWFTGGGICEIVTATGSHKCDVGDVVIFEAEEWHELLNLDSVRPLSLYFTVTPNVIPSHTYFNPDGSTYPRSLRPLTVG